MKRAGLVLTLIAGILTLILGILNFAGTSSTAFTGITAVVLGVGLILWTAGELGTPKKD